MEYTYTDPGVKYINIDNLACAPEIDRLYTIETIGDEVSADKAAYTFGGEIQLFDENGIVSSNYRYLSCDVSCLEQHLMRAGDLPSKVRITIDDDADMNYCDASVVIPSGISVAEYIKPLSNSINKIAFPLQTESMSVQPYTFYGFKELTSIYIPPYVTDIQEGAFTGCDKLCKVMLPSTLSDRQDVILNAVGRPCAYIYDIKNYSKNIGAYDINLDDLFNFDENTAALKSSMLKAGKQDDADIHFMGYVQKHEKHFYKQQAILSSCSYKLESASKSSDFEIECESIDVDDKSRDFHTNLPGIDNIDDFKEIENNAIKNFKKNYEIPLGIKNNIINQYSNLNKSKFIEQYSDDGKTCTITVIDKNKNKDFDTERSFCITYPDRVLLAWKECVGTNMYVPHYSYKYYKITIKGKIKYNGSSKETNCTESSIVEYTNLIVRGGLSVAPCYHKRTIDYNGNMTLSTWIDDNDWKTLINGDVKTFWHNDNPTAMFFKEPHYMYGSLICSKQFNGDANFSDIVNDISNAISSNLDNYRPWKNNLDKLYKYHEELGMCPFL